MAAVTLMAATVLVGGASAQASAPAKEHYPVPKSGVFTLAGRGFGHGIGMSQFGAEGMGRLGKGYRQILRFYYPGTTLRTGPTDRTIVVELSAADRVAGGRPTVVLRAVDGLRLATTSGTLTPPAQVGGAVVRTVQVTSVGHRLTVRASSAAGKTTLAAHLRGTVRAHTGAVRTRSAVGVVAGRGDTTRYRGFVTVRRAGGGLQVLNDVLLEDYLRAVVSAEVPGGWTMAAYRAQAVAARSYALLSQRTARSSGRAYDICDTTWCQAYGGTRWETSEEAQAVRDTAGQYLESGGAPAFTQFSSSNGGYSVAGTQDYLVARPDPYDGVVKGAANWGHSWSTTVSASRIESAWSQIGSLRTLRVVERDGHGRFGGRVQVVALVGSAGKVRVSGDTFRSVLGLKSTWWTVTRA